MDLKSGEIGAEGDFDLVIEGGKVKLVVKYDGKGVDGEVSVVADPDYFLDKLAARIPGEIDDAVIGMLKSAIKAT